MGEADHYESGPRPAIEQASSLRCSFPEAAVLGILLQNLGVKFGSAEEAGTGISNVAPAKRNRVNKSETTSRGTIIRPIKLIVVSPAGVEATIQTNGSQDGADRSNE